MPVPVSHLGPRNRVEDCLAVSGPPYPEEGYGKDFVLFLGLLVSHQEFRVMALGEQEGDRVLQSELRSDSAQYLLQIGYNQG